MSTPAENDPKPRVEQSVPTPEPTEAMDEMQKRALELSGEIEHLHGDQREQTAEKAEALDGPSKE